MRYTHYDEYKKRWQINNDYGAVMIDELNYAVGEAIDKLAAYEDTGVEPEDIEDRQDVCLWIPENRFAEIINAEAQGRLVILPCKVGDMVYYRRGGYIIGDDVKRIVLDGIDGQVIVDHNHAYMFSDFGSNVWTSREEAEAALAKE